MTNPDEDRRPRLQRIPGSKAYAFIHPCETCGMPGVFGYGVALLQGKPGRWRCGKHQLVQTNPTPRNEWQRWNRNIAQKS